MEQLREVKPLEINKDIKSLPNGVFGYVYGWYIARKYKNPLEMQFQKRSPSLSENRFFFRLEKISENQIRVKIYVSDESELVINDWQSHVDKEIIAFPFAYNEFKNPVYITLNSELNIKKRDVEKDDGTEVSILEIKLIKKLLDQKINKWKLLGPRTNKDFLGKLFWKFIIPVSVLVVATLLIYLFRIK
ncbi:hypothetical protein ACFL0A_01035 [Patescibacteria group bacterium]